VRAHLIEQQRIAKDLPHGAARQDVYGFWWPIPRGTVVVYDGRDVRSLESLQEDPATWVWACGGAMGLEGHHGDLDGRRDVHRPLRVPRAALPVETERFAVEFGFEAYLERKYGPLRPCVDCDGRGWGLPAQFAAGHGARPMPCPRCRGRGSR
jgi:hypothetical protein